MIVPEARIQLWKRRSPIKGDVHDNKLEVHRAPPTPTLLETAMQYHRLSSMNGLLIPDRFSVSQELVFRIPMPKSGIYNLKLVNYLELKMRHHLQKHGCHSSSDKVGSS